jgi:hypothetical protein
MDREKQQVPAVGMTILWDQYQPSVGPLLAPRGL